MRTNEQALREALTQAHDLLHRVICVFVPSTDMAHEEITECMATARTALALPATPVDAHAAPAVAGGYPAMPSHPEPHTMKWSQLETEAITQYGRACYEAAQRQPTAPVAAVPSEADAHAMGAKGAPASEAERLLFEAWMKGHCWALSAAWDGTQYLSPLETDGEVDPRAMATRRLFAAWRDRAALAAAAPASVPSDPTPQDLQRIADGTRKTTLSGNPSPTQYIMAGWRAAGYAAQAAGSPASVTGSPVAGEVQEPKWTPLAVSDDDSEESRKDMPQRLRGRGDFHMKKRRIKDAEMLFDAALEIHSLRQQLAHFKKAAQ